MTHEPVMLNEIINFLEACLRTREEMRPLRILDGTLGAGGYTRAILENFRNCSVIGIDRDEFAIDLASENLRDYESRFRAIHGNFGELENFELGKFDALVFDLGVSNMQISIPERGFSFQNDGVLDMRMDRDNPDLFTASEILEKLSERELTQIFRDYGEEKYAALIAHGIKKYSKRINTTGELVKLIREILPQPVQRKMGTHPARRIFQALRIYVNDELGELENLLAKIPEFAKPDGALIIIVSYHSLEDRLVKRTFRNWKLEYNAELLTRHPLTPSLQECERNYKSRSAKLRAVFLK